LLEKSLKIWYNRIKIKEDIVMKVEIFTESIKLSQLLKYSGVVFSGAEAKNVIKKGVVPFKELFKSGDRSENVATFLAVLELIKSKKIGIDDKGDVSLHGQLVKKHTSGKRG
jgi:hypothetical protein